MKGGVMSHQHTYRFQRLLSQPSRRRKYMCLVRAVSHLCIHRRIRRPLPVDIYLILRSLFCSVMTGRGLENPLPPTEPRALASHQEMAAMWPDPRAGRIVRCPQQALARTRGVGEYGLC